MNTRRAARLRARPRENAAAAAAEAPTGLRRLDIATPRDGLLYVPSNYQANQPAPLIGFLHGAGGQAANVLPPIRGLAERTGALLLAPESRGETWDVILRNYGPDVRFIDRALEQVFASYAVDPSHVAIAGFSDGASYALSLGLANGGLFSHILAFSPGFMAPPELRDSPRIFVSHGVHDRVLPIDACSRRLVPRLREADLDVEYHEFDGGHTMPTGIVDRAAAWFRETSGEPVTTTA